MPTAPAARAVPADQVSPLARAGVMCHIRWLRHATNGLARRRMTLSPRVPPQRCAGPSKKYALLQVALHSKTCLFIRGADPFTSNGFSCLPRALTTRDGMGHKLNGHSVRCILRGAVEAGPISHGTICLGISEMGGVERARGALRNSWTLGKCGKLSVTGDCTQDRGGSQLPATLARRGHAWCSSGHVGALGRPGSPHVGEKIDQSPAVAFAGFTPSRRLWPISKPLEASPSPPWQEFCGIPSFPGHWHRRGVSTRKLRLHSVGMRLGSTLCTPCPHQEHW